MRKVILWNLMTLDGYFEGPSKWDLWFHELVWGEELEARPLESGGVILFYQPHVEAPGGA